MSEKTNKKNQETQKSSEEAPYTQKEMVEMRERMVQFYNEELPYLKLQAEYEGLMADVEEHKVRRMTMMIRGAQMYAAGEAAEKQEAGTPGAPEEETETNINKGRKLKKN
jgi:hypothetical protein